MLFQVYLAPAESDAEGSDFVISADESDGEGGKVVLKKRARSRYLALLEGKFPLYFLYEKAFSPFCSKIIFLYFSDRFAV
jgi:hypothetical protein